MNLFVARLSPFTTTKDLQKLFAHYGLVTTVKVIFDHATGLSKRYGFVEMPIMPEAHEALKELDNTSFQDSIISVKESLATEYRNSTAVLGYRNRVTSSSGTGNLQEYNSTSTSLVKVPRDNFNRRNFGYRGSGYRDFV